MDRTVKILLGMIAASLFMLNLQLAGFTLVKEAQALPSQTIKVQGLETGLSRIASKIDDCCTMKPY